VGQNWLIGSRLSNMRIGFATIYSWRPHVEHTWYLALLAQRAGHEVRFLTCDSDLPTCYTRELRDRSGWRECLQCRMGGIRSYTAENVASIGQFCSEDHHGGNAQQEWAGSSASTLGRFESPEDYRSQEFYGLLDKLKPVVSMTYNAARNWILKEKLDAVCVFNGRMDATRAIFEAAKSLAVPVVSHERTWFGDGIQLFPGEHCLGLSSVWQMIEQWKDKALTRAQAYKAASLVAKRFLKQNQTEWRAYNQAAIAEEWPVRSGHRRFLILPSSTNETWGHLDWSSGWQSPLEALDAIIDKLPLKPQDLVLRCHPNWAEKIGKRNGSLPEAYFSQWARKRGIHCIMSHERTSTMHLIQQCEAIVVAAGSAALEAGMLGKPVISISPSIYHRAGFTCNVHDRSQLENLNSFGSTFVGGIREGGKQNARQALRFAYAMVWRLPQYVEQVRAISTTKYEYIKGADPQRFLDLFENQRLMPDDDGFALTEDAGEDEVLELIAAQQWLALTPKPSCTGGALETLVKRRGFYKMLDQVRSLSRVGDR